MEDIIKKVSVDLKVKPTQVKSVLSLLEEGNTVPFIARYRKEMTGALDEDQIRFIDEHYKYQVNLAKRKEDVIRLIETLGKMDDELRKSINDCDKISQVDEIYKPYQQKKKTRATVAIAAGLQPLADEILKLSSNFNIDNEYPKYINDTITSKEEVISGVQDIIAEIIAEDLKVKSTITKSIKQFGKIVSKLKKNAIDETKIYRMYYDYSERVSTVAPHRIMALDRGESEKILNVSFDFNLDYVNKFAEIKFIGRRNSSAKEYVLYAIEDGLKRLAIPSVSRFIRNELSEQAHDSSSNLFANNLEKLLLQPPLINKNVLGFDPAYRTGCKLAIVDLTGKVLHIDVIYPHEPVNKLLESKTKLLKLIKQFNINLIAIGNGTASRESELLISNLIKENNLNVEYLLVSEAGASIYSASKLAKEEFPDLKVEQRSAISIARRIQDPLSELIKIDPQSIGVGQYQHDIPKTMLNDKLDFVISKAVNRVGVDINTASYTLLSKVSGLSMASAKSIVEYRDNNGVISSRKIIAKIPKIGPKSFIQSAGFLRIINGEELLDMTNIHPESYKDTYKVLEYLNLNVDSIGTKDIKDIINNLDINNLSTTLNIDIYTLNDICDSLKEPLKDYRDKFDKPILRSDILKFEEVKINDEFQGVVRNVVDFGAFIDIGLKEDALIHISGFNKRIKHPSDIVSVGQIIKVKVKDIDLDKHKIQLNYIGE